MEVVHARCAGLDVSKKDAKVCVRVAGAGRRKTVETVTTGHDLVLDDQSGPRCASTWSPTGHLRGDGGDWGLLEAVLLPA